MKLWAKIKEGATACIIAPAYGVATQADISVALDDVTKLVKLYKLNPYIYPNMLAPGNHSLFDSIKLPFSNTDEVRFNHLIDAFNNPDCNLIWAFRGGYGSIRLLDKLKNERAPSEVKLIIGFSDITVLHAYVNAYWDWPSIHFGMPGALPNVMKKDYSISDFQQVIFGKVSKVKFKMQNLDLLNEEINITGITAGGNILNYGRILSTYIKQDLKDKILILEEIGEQARWLDGFLQQLKLASNFEKIKAIVFGSILPFEETYLFNQVINIFQTENQIPIFKLYEEDTIGHGAINRVLPLNTPACITKAESNEYYELTITTGIKAHIHDEL